MAVVLRAGWKATPGVAGVLLLSTMIYLVWGLIAVELWAGLLKGNCGYEDPTTATFTQDPAGAFCALPCSAFEYSCNPSWGDSCATTSVINVTTGDVISLPMECGIGRAPSDGQANVDNVGYAALFAFVIVTTEGWTGMMYATWHAWGFPVRVRV